MKELYLDFVDPNGDEQTVVVEGNAFVVGRHSGCDLVIQDSRLSREHIKIERFADVFTVSDLKSSNGTMVDGEVLEGVIALESREGQMVLGGGIEVSYSFDTDEEDEPEPEADQPAPAQETGAASASSSGSEWGIALLLIPILGIFVLLFGGIAAIYFLSGDSGENTAGRRENGGYSSPDDSFETPEENPTFEPQFTPTSTPILGPVATVTPGIDPISPTPAPTSVGPDATPNGTVDRKTEALVYSFMRKIAKNDQRPYLKTRRFEEVASRTNRFKGSRALAANIRNASSNATRIRSLAAERNLQPQFLAAAAITKMGNNTGDVAAKASEIVGVLDRLTTVLGNELADDALLVIAAFDEGQAGNNLVMRNRLARLAKKNPTATPREIRTIWFLQEKGEISAAQYGFALNFLAVGTIAQNPKDFNVNSEGLKL